MFALLVEMSYHRFRHSSYFSVYNTHVLCPINSIYPEPQSFTLHVSTSVAIIFFRRTRFVLPSIPRRSVLNTRPKPIVTFYYIFFDRPSFIHNRSIILFQLSEYDCSFPDVCELLLNPRSLPVILLVATLCY